MLAIHLTAPFVIARAAVALPRPRRCDRERRRSPGSSPGRELGYNAAKAGLINLTRTIATEYAAQGIRANCVCPGIVDTHMSRDYIGAADDPAEAEREAHAAQPIGRMGTPDEIAELIAFLASPAASFITGEAIAADGSFLAL
jgi:NAD(P)-dependent dehydrogenase (short-subunit alcohol dehydrogenase family)